MGECKAKAIQTNLGIFRHNRTYPEIIQAYSDLFRTLCYPHIFYNYCISIPLTYSKPEAYPEPWYIENPNKFRTLTKTMMREGVLRYFMQR